MTFFNLRLCILSTWFLSRMGKILGSSSSILHFQAQKLQPGSQSIDKMSNVIDMRGILPKAIGMYGSSALTIWNGLRLKKWGQIRMLTLRPSRNDVDVTLWGLLNKADIPSPHHFSSLFGWPPPLPPKKVTSSLDSPILVCVCLWLLLFMWIEKLDRTFAIFVRYSIWNTDAGWCADCHHTTLRELNFFNQGLFHLNKYKIPFGPTLRKVFSGTMRTIQTFCKKCRWLHGHPLHGQLCDHEHWLSFSGLDPIWDGRNLCLYFNLTNDLKILMKNVHSTF